jgi:type II secretory ATPase GspE/PulE/Tfp pilus assembly ATPase PilB-like protein
VIAQRLVRKICPSCKEKKTNDSQNLSSLGVDNIDTYFGRGCKNCRMTGYYGRIGIFELIEINDDLKLIINKNKSEIEIKEIMNTLQEKKHKTMLIDGIQKIKDGITTVDEVSRVIKGT